MEGSDTRLNYAIAAQYTITVVCEDHEDNTQTATTSDPQVNVLPNEFPDFDDYPSVTTASVSATGASVGDTVYTASATDPEGNSITYQMTQSPDSGYFDIDPNTGEITVARSLEAVTDLSSTLTVTACDPKGCNADTLTVTVPITDQNTAPSIDNLPATVSVLETATAGHILETLTITDAQGQRVTTTCSVSPASESYKFAYDTVSKRLKLATVSSGQTLLDYDSGTRQYKITCIADDGALSSSGDVLTVNVENVNEAPVFSSSMYYCTLTESDAGVSQCSPNLLALDPDGDTIIYTFLPGNNSERFTYSSATDTVSFAVDYDVDNNVMPTTAIVTIQVTDPLGLTATSQITITVEDANDNTCDFTDITLTSTIDQSVPVGTILAAFTATDADLTFPNNDVTYETISGDTPYFYIFADGQPDTSIWDEDWFVAVFSILMCLLGLALLGLLAYCLCYGPASVCYRSYRPPEPHLVRVSPRSYPRLRTPPESPRPQRPRLNNGYKDYAWGNGKDVKLHIKPTHKLVDLSPPVVLTNRPT
ncbi:hypothetical protein BaRGS_00036035 [Batillaria attramentaria]|uniref:Cadherin domain-containing protein n=1 Tax=Batillaria attramentaria TaxID=370345 RepID=A0ABD0JCY5_9CAEN